MRANLTIRKTAQDLRLPPHLADYARERQVFSWSGAAHALQGLPAGGLNLGYEAADRHARGALASRAALRVLGQGQPPGEITYAELARLSTRFAASLHQLGVTQGDRVFVLTGPSALFAIAVLGTLKAGAVAAPLCASFGPEPVATRINLAQGRVLVTTRALHDRTVRAWRGRMPSLRHVLIAPDGRDDGNTGCARNESPGTVDLAALMAGARDDIPVAATTLRDPALLHFTSGTTGAPKGAVLSHATAIGLHASARYALDLHDQDRLWCTADPGSAAGTAYGLLAPLLHGITTLVDRADFDAARCLEVLERERVSVWYTSPVALRLLMRSPAPADLRHRLPALRHVATGGEPLSPGAAWWCAETLGVAAHDGWSQTETGAIMIANTPAFEIRPGSMGRPLPGVQAAVVERLPSTGGDGLPSVRIIDTPGEDGELALRAGWPSMFRGYVDDEARYRRCFADGWYLTGDLVRRDADDYYWFLGRRDDAIGTAGQRVGAFEIECSLLEHDAVAEAAAIGVPVAGGGEVVKAFVSLKPGREPDEALRQALLEHARRRLGTAAAPRTIAFAQALPRTASGTLMHRLLRARELGLPEGDTSALAFAG
jgi:acetyl-CoA synthetase